MAVCIEVDMFSCRCLVLDMPLALRAGTKAWPRMTTHVFGPRDGTEQMDIMTALAAAPGPSSSSASATGLSVFARRDRSVLEHEGAHMLPVDPKCLNCGRPSGGLVAEMNAIEPVGDPLDNSAHALIRGVDLADEANFSLPAGIRNRDGVPKLCDIDSDKCFPII
ncbi:hypothetical protein X767_31415 [Mesorhizobium sp. LSJC264A00]|nr:hypothetical protein X767_31415 [Mesorhizobium sp. LSJC264A00]